MPKLNDRERLAKIEAHRRKLADEADTVRRAMRAGYGVITAELAIETLTEREFRNVLAHAIRAGGPTAVAALKVLSAVPGSS